VTCPDTILDSRDRYKKQISRKHIYIPLSKLSQQPRLRWR